MIDPVGNFRPSLKVPIQALLPLCVALTIDTVLYGGKLDGAAGAVACIGSTYCNKGTKRSHKNIRSNSLPSWRRALSFGGGLIGSKALVGKYTVEDPRI